MRKILFLLIFLLFFVWLFAQTGKYDYTIVIKVEGKSIEDAMRIKDELYMYAEKNRLAIETYSKKDYKELLQLKSQQKK